ncbi:MAG TPA: hypothetical protein DCS97_10440 [Planctomycetes bacterium]|nr:hypothetical protein [Planctomycetota bacterium]
MSSIVFSFIAAQVRSVPLRPAGWLASRAAIMVRFMTKGRSASPASYTGCRRTSSSSSVPPEKTMAAPCIAVLPVGRSGAVNSTLWRRQVPSGVTSPPSGVPK